TAPDPLPAQPPRRCDQHHRPQHEFQKHLHRHPPTGSTPLGVRRTPPSGSRHYLRLILGISKRIFPAAISSSATVTGLAESTSTIGSAPSFSCRARLAATITRA